MTDRSTAAVVARFILRRAAFAVVLVLVASSSSLLLTRVVPGDLSTELGPLARAGEVAGVRAQYGLDQPASEQWRRWAWNAVQLDFGRSYLYGQPVGPLVRRAAANTFVLAITALVVATVAGLGLGLLSGTASAAVAMSIRALSLVGLSLPPLLTSIVLVFIAARTGLLPTGGMTSVNSSDLSWAAWMADVLRHLPLPALALALPMAATFERLQSQSLAQALQQPFVRAVAAKGVDHRSLVLRHAWPLSLSPLCGVYGVAVGALLSGSFIVETVMAWPGLGLLLWDALRARDIYLVAGCAAGGAALIALGMLVGDLLLAFVDPRTRGMERA